MRAFFCFLLSALCLLSGCSKAPERLAAPEARSANVRPVNLQSAIERARLAFVEQAGVFVATVASLDVRVERARVSIAPRGSGEAALDLELISLGRPDAVQARNGVPSRAPDGSLRIERASAAETLRGEPGGLEQSWLFAHEPPGTGDLQVKLRTSGMPFVGQTEGGAHFRPKSGSTGVRYGGATWIDAVGKRTRLDMRVARGELTLTVPAVVLAASAYPATLDPLISPEMELDEPVPTIAHAAHVNQVVCGAAQCAVVWNSIHVSLASLEGEALGALPVPIGEHGSSPLGLVKVGAGASGFLATRSDTYSTPAWAARLSPEGVLDDLRIDLPVAIVDTVVSSGDRYIVVGWRVASGGGTELVAFRLEGGKLLDGGPLTGGTVLATLAPNVGHVPAVACSGGGQALVTWGGGTAARLSFETGQALDPAPIVLTTYETPFSSSTVAFDGSNFVVAWVMFSPPRIEGVRVRASDGVVLDTADEASGSTGAVTMLEVEPDPTVEWEYLFRPRLFFDEGSFLLFTYDGLDSGWNKRLWARSVDASSLLADPASRTLVHSFNLQPSSTLYFDMDWTDGHGMLATTTQSYEAMESEVDAFPLHPSPGGLAVGAPRLLANQQNEEQDPAVASNGDSFLVVWSDDRDGIWNKRGLWGIRVSNDGETLDAAAFPIRVPIDTNTSYRVASDGKDFMVAWGEVVSPPGYTIGVRRVAASGDPLSGGDAALPSPLDAMGMGVPRALTFEGSRYLLVTASTQAAGSNVTAVSFEPADAKVFGQAALGTVSTSGGSWNIASRPGLTPETSASIVSWSAPSSQSGRAWRVRGSLLQVFDQPWLSDEIPGSTLAGIAMASMTSDSSSFFAAGRYTLPGLSTSGLAATRISSSDGSAIAAGSKGMELTIPEYHGVETLNFDGRTFVVTWPSVVPGVPGKHRLMLGRITPGGVPLDTATPGGLEVGEYFLESPRTGVASAKNGRSLLVRTALVDGPFNRGPRLKANLLVNDWSDEPMAPDGGTNDGGEGGSGGATGGGAGAGAGGGEGGQAGSAPGNQGGSTGEGAAEAGGAGASVMPGSMGGSGQTGGGGAAGAGSGSGGATAAGDAGEAGGQGTGVSPDPTSDGVTVSGASTEGGCACRASSRRSPPGGLAAVIGLAALATTSRRKQRGGGAWAELLLAGGNRRLRPEPRADRSR
jgi:large repetitive protein